MQPTIISPVSLSKKEYSKDYTKDDCDNDNCYFKYNA